MKPVNVRGPEVHVLVCDNEREGSDPIKSSCGKVGGRDFFRKLKTKARAEGMLTTHWITRTGCLGFCNPVGTTIKIMRAGEPDQWFTEVVDADFDAIWEAVAR